MQSAVTGGNMSPARHKVGSGFEGTEVSRRVSGDDFAKLGSSHFAKCFLLRALIVNVTDFV